MTTGDKVYYLGSDVSPGRLICVGADGLAAVAARGGTVFIRACKLSLAPERPAAAVAVVVPAYAHDGDVVEVPEPGPTPHVLRCRHDRRRPWDGDGGPGWVCLRCGMVEFTT